MTPFWQSAEELADAALRGLVIIVDEHGQRIYPEHMDRQRMIDLYREREARLCKTEGLG